MTISISSTSAELVGVTFEVNQGGLNLDPDGQPVWLAFVPEGETPEAGDWIVATWGDDGGIERTAEALADRLAPGRYDIWGRVSWGVEDFRREAGKLVVK